MYHLLLIETGSDKLLIEALNASRTQVTAIAHFNQGGQISCFI